MSSQFPQHSPTVPASHAHPPSRHNSISQSPRQPLADSPIHRRNSSYLTDPNGAPAHPAREHSYSVGSRHENSNRTQEDHKASNPMSFSNILSSNAPDVPSSTPAGLPPVKQFRRAPSTPNGDAGPPSTAFRRSSHKSALAIDGHRELPKPSKAEISHPIPVKAHRPKARVVPSASDKENERIEKEIARIDAMELSDIDSPDWTPAKQDFVRQSNKRLIEVQQTEDNKRKRRRTASSKKYSEPISAHAEDGKQRFRDKNKEAAESEVRKKEQQDEKERKKDMQRKRRREKTVQQAMQNHQESLLKAEATNDTTEKERLLREAHKAERKAKNTQKILEHGDLPGEIREATPLAPNLEGGTMSTFQTGNEISPEPPRKKQKGPSIRPKKSKEKKQAEKDAAAAAYAAMEQDNLVLIAPKEETRRGQLIRETKEAKQSKEASPAISAPLLTNYASKGYAQIYEQIWKDISRKDAPKVYRIKDNSLSTKQSNLRKTAQLASKEARRWQLRTNKGMKDVQARAKRSMREMMSFWKRNEREERDMRRAAERQELENAKKAEADREANRQKRKLNFLISQTELYSHFIGRKIKTDQVERSTDTADVGVSDTTIQPGEPGAPTVNLPNSVAKVEAKVTNFEDLDFDAEDESVLQQAAMANAQNAVQEAQDKARAFNGEDNDLQNRFDEGEMNFQNPTSMGEENVTQPKMLNAQLKEYQLKGLGWLVNLYEQGINGILADEMGLGKTVQSISVMAYLAEKHDIWGPFLVVAPSSTLHNWQQEITRFVPDLKCLPYWGNAKDRKVLRKFWDRKHITYNKDSPFHVLITSYQLVVQDMQYFQKIRWQYMILDEAQAIKSAQSTRWKALLGFHCRNRLLLTGTPIQNSMQELWALLHFIMPSLFDSHDEFSEWFSKDIESHAQSHTKLNEAQLKRLHAILRPFMLRRVKKHVQKELGDKIEEDVYCDLTYRQRAYYGNLRSRISIMDLIEKAALGDDQDTATLMNLVMQFRKVCNHPDLFERADTSSPLSMAYYAECASFVREGHNVNLVYSSRNLIEYDLPRLLNTPEARLDMAGPGNDRAGWRTNYLGHCMNIWKVKYIHKNSSGNGAFSWLRFADVSAGEVSHASRRGLAERAINLDRRSTRLARLQVLDDGENQDFTPAHALFRIVDRNDRRPLAELTDEHRLHNLLNISRSTFEEQGLNLLEPCARPAASAPPIEVCCSNQGARVEKENTLFNVSLRRALYGLSEPDEAALIESKVDPALYPVHGMLPPPLSEITRYTPIQVPSMRRFVTDSGKLAKLDQLLRDLKQGGHRVLLYFQMTRMIDLMEEYLTYRNYKYLRLDGSTKLEDRRDTVHDFQTRPDIFIFLLSTRAGGLGINLTAADTVIFYDSDWNPTIDSQAMDRAHRLGQTRQVTVYRMITRGTIEERIRKRALQKEEVQRVVIAGGGGAGVDFNTRSKENRSKDIVHWLADDDQADIIEQKEKEMAEKSEETKKGKKKTGGRKKDVSMDDLYHEGEGHFGDDSNKASGAATPIDAPEPAAGKRKGISKKAKTTKQRLAIIDGGGD
ncbi:Putative DNA helicase ino80 [Xanthoria calcicola]